jgi:hypothetical protein
MNKLVIKIIDGKYLSGFHIFDGKKFKSKHIEEVHETEYIWIRFEEIDTHMIEIPKYCHSHIGYGYETISRRMKLSKI